MLGVAAQALAGCRFGAGGREADTSAVGRGHGNGMTLSAEPDAEAAAAVVSWALCQHYGVQRPEELGHGGAARLARCALEGQQAGLPPAWGVASAAALAASGVAAGSAAQQQQHQQSGGAAGALGDLGRGVALAALRAAPLLCDLHLHLQWRGVFEPTHGPLEQFVRRECAAAGAHCW